MVVKASKPKPTKYNKGGGVLGEFGNFVTDTLRGQYNAGADIKKTITGKSGTRFGDRFFGTAPKPKAAPKKAPAKAAPKKPAADQGSLAADQAWQDPVKSFQEYLAQAQGMTQGVDFTPQINQLKLNASSGDARLNAMYQQLQNSYRADAPGIQKNYDTAAAEQTAAAEKARATTQQGYDQTRQAQSQQFAQLGIPEAAGVLAANGANAARDQATSNADMANLASINQQQTAANKGTALTYNTRVTQAAGAEGASQRATLQQTLANKLAAIAQQQQEARVSQQNQAYGLASTLADFDNAAAQRRASANDPTAMLKLQQLAAQIQGQNLKNQNYAAAQGGNAGASFAQAQQMAIKAGIDPKDAAAMDAFVRMLKNSQGLNLG